jgi:hypothetical protein
MLFSKRKKVDRFIKPVQLNRVIHPIRSKYLGVFLCARLAWREYVKQRRSKVYSSF